MILFISLQVALIYLGYMEISLPHIKTDFSVAGLQRQIFAYGLVPIFLPIRPGRIRLANPQPPHILLNQRKTHTLLIQVTNPTIHAAHKIEPNPHVISFPYQTPVLKLIASIKVKTMIHFKCEVLYEIRSVYLNTWVSDLYPLPNSHE